LSRRQKADSISLKSGIRTLASLTHHMAQKPDWATVIQSVQNMSRTKAGIQNAVMTEPYIKMSRMSTSGKLSSLATFFVCHVSGDVKAKFCQESVLYRKV
jgi:hypothetical protein